MDDLPKGVAWVLPLGIPFPDQNKLVGHYHWTPPLQLTPKMRLVLFSLCLGLRCSGLTGASFNNIGKLTCVCFKVSIWHLLNTQRAVWWAMKYDRHQCQYVILFAEGSILNKFKGKLLAVWFSWFLTDQMIITVVLFGLFDVLWLGFRHHIQVFYHHRCPSFHVMSKWFTILSWLRILFPVVSSLWNLARGAAWCTKPCTVASSLGAPEGMHVVMDENSELAMNLYLCTYCSYTSSNSRTVYKEMPGIQMAPYSAAGQNSLFLPLSGFKAVGVLHFLEIVYYPTEHYGVPYFWCSCDAFTLIGILAFIAVMAYISMMGGTRHLAAISCPLLVSHTHENETKKAIMVMGPSWLKIFSLIRARIHFTNFETFRAIFLL